MLSYKIIPVFSRQSFRAFLLFQPRPARQILIPPAARGVIIITLAHKIRRIDHRAPAMLQPETVIIITHTVHICRIQISHSPEALVCQQQTVAVKGIALFRLSAGRDQFISRRVFRLLPHAPITLLSFAVFCGTYHRIRLVFLLPFQQAFHRPRKELHIIVHQHHIGAVLHILCRIPHCDTHTAVPEEILRCMDMPDLQPFRRQFLQCLSRTIRTAGIDYNKVQLQFPNTVGQGTYACTRMLFSVMTGHQDRDLIHVIFYQNRLLRHFSKVLHCKESPPHTWGPPCKYLRRPPRFAGPFLR